MFRNLPKSTAIRRSILSALDSGDSDGYPPSTGYLKSRQAVAEFADRFLAAPISSDNIILTSGCSHALDMVISALCDPGDNILIPSPGFSLYRTICDSYNFDCISYPLNVTTNFESFSY